MSDELDARRGALSSRHDRDFKLSGGNTARATLYLSSTGVDTTARHTTSALFLYQTVDLLRIHY